MSICFPTSNLSLPNVYPELAQCTLDGSPLIVRNTFIDVMPSNTEMVGNGKCRRAKSMPAWHNVCNTDSCTQSLLETRIRLLTFACGEQGAQYDSAEKSPRSCTASTCTPASSVPASPTTVMLKHLPAEYTREMLLDSLTVHGFSGLFDFVYVPMDFGTHASFGYASINLVSSEDAERFFVYFQDFNDWSVPSDKAADVDWSGDHQGLEPLIERYRNSPMMHRSVPDEAKPILLQDGVRIPFPPPTKTVKPLRIRQSKARKARNLGLAEIQADPNMSNGD